MTDNFYRAFEERFRGSREVIQERLRVYIPFIEPLLPYLKTGRSIDIGCGRGEWLELMMELGLEAVGVDLDDGMLAACRERNLVVHTQDALEYLKGLPDESQVVVSGFHLVEHVSFSFLRNLVLEAKRVLEPGGLLIFETPNPENLVVCATSFYLDPTHNRPIPPKLLEFICEYSGFKRTKIVRLQESKSLLNNNEPTLLDVLSGVSPDYAVVAQKDGPKQMLKAIEPAFQANYGLNLETIASRFQIQTMQSEDEARYAELIPMLYSFRKTSRIAAIFEWANAERKWLKRLLKLDRLESRLKASVKKRLSKAKDTFPGKFFFRGSIKDSKKKDCGRDDHAIEDYMDTLKARQIHTELQKAIAKFEKESN